MNPFRKEFKQRPGDPDPPLWLILALVVFMALLIAAPYVLRAVGW